MATKGSVLIVDDDRDSREMLEEYLRHLGFEVTTAVNGTDGVACAELAKPDLILMDLAMPGLIDGWEAARMIRQRPICRDSRILAVTAHTYPAYHQLALHAGCHAVIVKPYDLDALSTMVHQFAHRTPTGPSAPDGGGTSGG